VLLGMWRLTQSLGPVEVVPRVSFPLQGAVECVTQTEGRGVLGTCQLWKVWCRRMKEIMNKCGWRN
jgi:hypothetical protein